MSDRYEMLMKVMGQNPIIDLTPEEFCKIKESRSILSASLALEQVYDFFTANLLEFEKELLSLSVDDMIYSDFTHNYFYSVNSAVGRRLANLLSSIRSFFDQAPRLFATCMADKNAIRVAKIYLSEQYDANDSYRVMEALRNHVQHQDVGVISNTIGAARDPTTRHLAYMIAPYIRGKMLLDSKKTKALVRPDIKEKMDVRLLVRSYAESISKVQKKLRQDSELSVKSAREYLDQCVARYKAQGVPEVAGLVAEHKKNDQIADSVPIFLQWDDTRKWLMSRNKSLGDFSKHYVSGQLGK